MSVYSALLCVLTDWEAVEFITVTFNSGKDMLSVCILH